MLRKELEKMIQQNSAKKQRHGFRGSLDFREDDTELVRMFKNLKADKWFCHSYVPIYEFLFEGFQYKSLNLAEIGIWRGHSIRIWEEYFPNASIVGMDIDPNCKKHNFSRAHVDICDQTDYKYFFKNYKDEKFDIFIEDGKHDFDAQILSASIFHSNMKENSIYIIEDINEDLEKFSILKGVPINLRKFKSRSDDQIILLPRGEYFTNKAHEIKEIVDSFTEEEIEKIVSC